MSEETQETQPGLNRSEEVYLIREAEKALSRLSAQPGQPVEGGKLAEAWKAVETATSSSGRWSATSPRLRRLSE